MTDHAPIRKLPGSARLAAVVALGLVTGCTQFPEVAAMPEDPTPEKPVLLPLDDLIAQDRAPAVAEPAADGLVSQAALLRARAARLRAEAAQP